MAPSLAAALKATTIDDHEEILAAADAALKSSKNDSLALHTRVVALLKLDRFDDVLRTVAASGDALKAQCAVETAYAYYKTGQLDEAATILKGLSDRSEGAAHLAGQVAYRDERFEEAWDIYNSFEEDAENGDLAVNKIAVLAQLGWSGKGSADYNGVGDIVAFEVAYNLACFHVSQGNLLKALQLLQLARRLCDSSDDLTEEEKQGELVSIIVQQIYVYSRLGLHDKAQELQKLLIVTDDCGADTAAIAKVNTAVLSSTEITNPFLAERHLESKISAAQKTKLFEFQSAALRQLQMVLDIGAQKFAGAQELFQKKSQTGPSSAFAINRFSPAGVIATCWKTPEKVLPTVVDLLNKQPRDVGLTLIAIQLSSQAGKIATAIHHLESLFKALESEGSDKSKSTRFAPGIVAVAVSLYKASGRDSQARSELAKAADFWKQHSASSARTLLVEAGLELLASDKPEDVKLAGETFEALLSSSPQDTIASVGLVSAIADETNPQVQPLLTTIPPTEDLIRDINVSSLLSAGIASNVAATTAGTKRPAPSSNTSAKPAKKRRQRKLPADYVEGKQLDPDRWLPLRDRASYRPKGGKKGKKKAEALTQGGAVNESLDIAAVAKAEKAPPAATAASKKKKKKGRK